MENNTNKKESTTSTKKTSTAKSSSTSSTKKSTTAASSNTAKKSSTSASSAKKSSSSSSSTKKKSTSSTSKKATNTVASTAKKEVVSDVSSKLAEKTGLDQSEVTKVVKEVSKLSPVGIVAVVGCFLVGLAGSYLGLKYVERNDQFSLINGDSFTVNVNDTFNYNDVAENVICISYGKNAIDSVTVDTVNTNIDLTTVGEYKLTYVSSNVKYDKISLTQIIYVVDAENSYSAE